MINLLFTIIAWVIRLLIYSREDFAVRDLALSQQLALFKHRYLLPLHEPGSRTQPDLSF